METKQIEQLKRYILEFDNFDSVYKYDVKIKTMEDLKNKLDSAIKMYKSDIDKELKELQNILKDYNFKLSRIMMLDNIDNLKDEYIKLSDEIDLDSLMAISSDLINDMEEINNLIDHLDNITYVNNLTKTDMLGIIYKLESSNNWDEYNTLTNKKEFNYEECKQTYIKNNPVTKNTTIEINKNPNIIMPILELF